MTRNYVASYISFRKAFLCKPTYISFETRAQPVGLCVCNLQPPLVDTILARVCTRVLRRYHCGLFEKTPSTCSSIAPSVLVCRRRVNKIYSKPLVIHRSLIDVFHLSALAKRPNAFINIPRVKQSFTPLEMASLWVVLNVQYVAV